MKRDWEVVRAVLIQVEELAEAERHRFSDRLIDSHGASAQAKAEHAMLVADQRSVPIADVDAAVVELQQDKPNQGRLRRGLGGTGAIVQTAASLMPAYEAIKAVAVAVAVARALGLPL